MWILFFINFFEDKKWLQKILKLYIQKVRPLNLSILNYKKVRHLLLSRILGEIEPTSTQKE